MPYYAGFGSRQTPDHILKQMTRLAKYLRREKGFILRSGHARGADRAFEAGANSQKEIFEASDCTAEALALSKKFHPAWDACDSYAKMLHGRNAMILLGADLKTPVLFGVCWTHDGKALGGSGQAIRIAESYKIPIFNLGNAFEEDKLMEFLETLE